MGSKRSQAESSVQHTPMRWWGWGREGALPALSAAALGGVAERIGLDGIPTPPVALEHVVVAPPRIGDAAVAALRRAVGEEAVRLGRRERILHAAGKGYLDLVRMRAGTPEGAPDAVLLPRDENGLRAALAVCARHDLAVVPFGGGTSVVGGLAPLPEGHAAVVSLDLARLAAIRLDTESRTVSAGAGLRVAALERELAHAGLTLGHFPQSYEYVTLGGCAATRSAGQASSGYGRFEEMVIGMQLIAPAGELSAVGVPASAAGPNLREVIVGSEGSLGVISSLTLRLAAAPASSRYEGFVFEDFEAGVATLRTLAQDGPTPTVARLSDEQETELSLLLAAGGGIARRITDAYVRARSGSKRCLAILGFEGSELDVRVASSLAGGIARANGALPLGERAGAAWLSSRFAAPYLRDELLTQGALVETLETAGTWSCLCRLRKAVGGAIEGALRGSGTPGAAGCHISHVYDSGASLYFTFLARRLPGSEEGQWRAVKDAATDAIVANGGTISHHHGVGRDHARWLEREIGADGIAALCALKARFDPDGLMNPGKLLLSEL
jgi:alkyldihydroxyacetonephosphate synthase